MKKTLLLAIVASCAMMAQAKSLVFKLTDGTEVYYLLGGEVNPILKIVEGEVAVNDDKYEFTGIERFYVSETDDPNIADGIQSVKTQMQDGVLYSKTAGTMRLYTVDGKLLQTSAKTEGGAVSLDTNQLPAGTYIINVNGKSVKFTKK